MLCFAYRILSSLMKNIILIIVSRQIRNGEHYIDYDSCSPFLSFFLLFLLSYQLFRCSKCRVFYFHRNSIVWSIVSIANSNFANISDVYIIEMQKIYKMNSPFLFSSLHALEITRSRILGKSNGRNITLMLDCGNEANSSYMSLYKTDDRHDC